ncbi:MAG: S8 family serine peptidase, partial [Acidimicrobiales bacterium]
GVHVAPTYVSKVNTALQIAFAALVIGVFAEGALPSAATAVAAPVDPPSAPDGVPTAGPGSASDIVGRHAVTLVTGDRVQLDVSADGHQAATVDPASREQSAAAFYVDERNGHLSVIPADASPHLTAGTLDPDLFDVTDLVRQGLADATSGGLPLIVGYHIGTDPRHAAAQADALPGTRHRADLESIGAVAVEVHKTAAAGFWQAVADSAPADSAAPAASAELGGGIQRIWLDEVVHAADEVSAPQIGAPTAWDLGWDGTGVTVAVLDTGIDAAHPDLEERVTEQVNFTTSDTMGDRYGHGTHVASIAAGTGAASGGLRRGIAHDARIFNVKVLGDDGTGLVSWMIDGAEWAAQAGADVANLSLSSEPTDGTDPAAQALNALTDEYGILFVTSAGNDGPGDMTVASPGTADRALAVGAVDSFDALAGFSSRGPRLGDFAIKPEIVAPGSLIIAARAAGTDNGFPLDEFYTRLSGTSMAAPHVAGAAAVLKEQHPEWGPAQLKAALASNAEPLADVSVYAQGAGRVDIGRAVTQTVHADAGVVDFGYFPWPHDDAEPVSRTVTYTNSGDASVTIDLEADVRDKAGEPAAPGMFSLSASELTIPPGDSRTLSMTVDPAGGGEGLYGGHLTATADGGTTLVTALGWNTEPRMVTLTVHGIGRDDRPARGISRVDVVDLDDSRRYTLSLAYEEGTATFRLPVGRYSVLSYVVTYDQPQRYPVDAALLGDPEIDLDRDRTMTLDADRATEVVVDTGQKVESTSVKLGYYRQPLGGSPTLGGIAFGPFDVHLSLQPMPQVETGTFEATTTWSLIHPILEARVPGRRQVALEPHHVQLSRRMDGRQELALVAVGDGRTEDYAEVDAAGKIALARWDWVGDSLTQMVAAAHQEGVAVLLVYADVAGARLFGTVVGGPVATYTLTQNEGRALLGLLAEGDVQLALHGTAGSPYLYDLMLPENGRVPANLRYQIRPDDVVRLDNRFHADVGAPGRNWFEVRHSWRPYQGGTAAFSRPLTTPHVRREYVSVGDTVWQQQIFQQGGSERFAEPQRVSYDRWAVIDQPWFGQVMRPSAEDTEYGAAAVRQGDQMVTRFPLVVDSGGHWSWSDNVSDIATMRLYEGDQLLGQSSSWSSRLPMRSEPAHYRLEISVERPPVWWLSPTQTLTEYEFHSAPPDAAEAVLPLLRVDYDLGLDITNRAPARRSFTFEVGVDHPSGAAAAPIEGLDMEVSYDDGATWQATPAITPLGDGLYEITVRHPPSGDEDRFASLRVRAWDAAGNRFSQEVIRAYGIATR